MDAYCHREPGCLDGGVRQVKCCGIRCGIPIPARAAEPACRAAGAAAPRGWSLRLQSCLRSFGQATEAKPLASGGLQGLAKHTKWLAWGPYHHSREPPVVPSPAGAAPARRQRCPAPGPAGPHRRSAWWPAPVRRPATGPAVFHTAAVCAGRSGNGLMPPLTWPKVRSMA
jgi:hypothetical protein